MAKRKRLTPLAPGVGPIVGPILETKSAPTAPIASVAGDSATMAALEEVSFELTSARDQGRLIQLLQISDIDENHLMRDRMVSDDDEMAALKDSLRTRGQQSPIEVTELVSGRFGLISGWRRLNAIRDLYAETKDIRFAAIQALVRAPNTAADAYLSMVEENEIRVGLSYYERARVAARAAEAGVFPTAQTALRGLFMSVSRSKRSKIGSFLVIYAELDSVLRFPAALSERAGLALAKALEADATLAARLKAALKARPPQDASQEQAMISALIDPPKATPDPVKTESIPPESKPTPTPASTPASTLDRPSDAQEPVAGVYLQVSGGALRPKYTLSGPKVDAAFREKLEVWLRNIS